MTTLADTQNAFLRAIHDDSVALPEGWGNSQAMGMQVYRGNYRSALMGALDEVYERTALYVGEGPFRQAGINHAITHPPSGWTIDEAGEDFDGTCAKLFHANPEVAELAWLEWAMRDLATAPDTQPLTPQEFAEVTAAFGDEEWTSLRLALQPRSTARAVGHDLEALWRALGEEEVRRPNVKLSSPATCLVWREGERPTFRMLEADHAAAFAVMSEGATYAEMIGALLDDDPDPAPEAIQNAAMRAGAILGQWLNEGVVTGINP